MERPGRSQARAIYEMLVPRPVTANDRAPLGCQIPGPVVRRFLGDCHVVHVALTEAGWRDADDVRVALQVGNGSTSGVTHARAQTANQLVNHPHHASRLP